MENSNFNLSFLDKNLNSNLSVLDMVVGLFYLDLGIKIFHMLVGDDNDFTT